MDNLTLVIPAKYEKESLPTVLEELKKYNLEVLVVVEETDQETINSIKNLDLISKGIKQINLREFGVNCRHPDHRRVLIRL